MIPPVLLDLCNVTIMHRFSSIGWFEHLAKHVSSEFEQDAFDQVVRLQVQSIFVLVRLSLWVDRVRPQTGQAIVLAPGGLGVFAKSPNSLAAKTHETFGRRWLVIKTRKRVTKDGGASILVV